MCVMVSYPLQFFIPMERVEKWVTRKIPTGNQTAYIYFARYGIVLLTCELILYSLQTKNSQCVILSHKFFSKIFEL